MDEAAAATWLREMLHVSRETTERLDAFVAMLREESAHQNLVASATLDEVGARHVVDSAQLALLAGKRRGAHWLDLGTGAGFPGMVLAIVLHQRAVSNLVTMVEERTKRHAWLSRVVERLALTNARVIGRDLARIPAFPADVVTARAFAPLGKLFDLAERFGGADTLWLLPKGRGAQEELASVRDRWHGDFRLSPSVVDPSSSIVVATGVERAAPAASPGAESQAGTGEGHA